MKFIPEELTILDSSPLSSDYAETFVYAPAGKNEEALGGLYVVGQIQSNKTKKENSQLLSELAAIIKNEYYRNTVITPRVAFKSALKKANRSLEEQKTLVKSASLKITILAAALKSNNIHLARLGAATAFIFRNNNLQYILPPNAPPLNKPDISFENISSGEILSNDGLLLATHQIHKLPEAEIIQHLKNVPFASRLKEYETTFKSVALIALRPTRKRGAEETPASSIGHIGPIEIPPPTAAVRKNSRKYKLALLVILVAAGSIALIIVGFKFKKESAANKKEAETLVEEMIQLKEKTNSLLALNNESEASELIGLWQEKLQRLNKLNYFSTTRLGLAEDLDKILKSRQKLENIDRLATVLELKNNSANFDPSDFTLGKNKIIVYNRETIYKFDINRREGNLNVLGANSNITAALEHPRDPDKIILLEKNKLVEYASANDSKNQNIVWSNGAEFKNLGYYKDTFYLLGEDNLIYKLTVPKLFEESPSTPSTSSPQVEDTVSASSEPAPELTQWTKKDAKINSTIDMAIDGSIYLLASDNSVTEFVNGAPKGRLKLIETVTKIFTLPNHKNIYLLAPSEGLILVVDKNSVDPSGGIKKRLSHPELKGAKSFFINSQERIIYFLKSKTVYSFEI